MAAVEKHEVEKHETEQHAEVAPGEPIIRVRGLVNRFGAQLVHDGVDLEVRQGEILGVVGGSGSGKSVLMRSILGLRTPDAGEIEVLGVDARSEAPEDRLHIERNTGVLFQDGALFSSLTVGENVQVPLKEHHRDLPDSLRYELALLKVKLAGLSADTLNKLPSQLSGGMRKRAGLARALAMDPPLLFLDEPTAGLDPIGAAAFDKLTRTLQQALGLTVFLITHDLDTLYAICDRVAVLADGKMIAVGPVAELEQLDHPWVQEYFNGPRGRAARDGASREQAVDKPMLHPSGLHPSGLRPSDTSTPDPSPEDA
jgi:phospholipid/cholesterol/gamma-HCH transport system ATP-binding protein